jgi:hypothetical protein
MTHLGAFTLGTSHLDNLPIYAPPAPYKPARLQEVPGIAPCPWERSARPVTRYSPEQLQERGIDWLSAAAELQGEHAARLRGYGYACLHAARYMLACKALPKPVEQRVASYWSDPDRFRGATVAREVWPAPDPDALFMGR